MKDQIEESINSGDADAENVYLLRLRLWVVMGFLEKNLSLQRLENVVATYKRIGIVPEGYN